MFSRSLVFASAFVVMTTGCKRMEKNTPAAAPLVDHAPPAEPVNDVASPQQRLLKALESQDDRITAEVKATGGGAVACACNDHGIGHFVRQPKQGAPYAVVWIVDAKQQLMPRYSASLIVGDQRVAIAPQVPTLYALRPDLTVTPLELTPEQFTQVLTAIQDKELTADKWNAAVWQSHVRHQLWMVSGDKPTEGLNAFTWYIKEKPKKTDGDPREASATAVAEDRSADTDRR